MIDLVVVVPSRGRPQAAAELLQTFGETCDASTELLFALDDDDPTVADYPAVKRVGPSRSMIKALNDAVAWCIGGGLGAKPFAVGFMGDDHRPRTVGWDQEYVKALRELGTGIVYGNDLLQGEKLPSQVAMTADIVDVLGYMAPPNLTHMYPDNAWLALGHAIGRIRYLPDVIVEHMHPLAGKAELDDGYRRVNHPAMYARDQYEFTKWLRESLPADAARLKRLVEP